MLLLLPWIAGARRSTTTNRCSPDWQTQTTADRSKTNSARRRTGGARLREREGVSAPLAPQTHHDVDARDLITLGRDRRLADNNVGRGDVHEIVLVFDEEVMVL